MKRGIYKAAYFQILGYEYQNKDIFEKALLEIAQNNDVTNIREIFNQGVYYGKSYEIIGKIGVRGKTRNIKTAWKILRKLRKPCLVTVTPM